MATRQKVDTKALARKRAEQLNKSPFYKLMPGDNCFRILPTPASKKTGELWYEYSIHRDVGPQKKLVRCGKDPVSGEGACWICDRLIPSLKKQGKEKRATALATQQTAMIQVAKVTMEDDEPKFEGPLLFQPSGGVFRQLLTKAFGSKKRSYHDATKGYNLNLDRTGTGKNDTKYGILEGDDEPTEVPADLIAKLKPFSELREIPVYDESLQKKTYQGDDEDDDDEEEDEDLEDSEDDEEEAPAPKKGKVKGKAAPVEDDDEDEDEDDDEDEAPPKKGKAKPAPVDDEDDDGDGDDEDTLPPPSKKGKAKAAPIEDNDDDDGDDEDDTPPKKVGKKGKAAPVEEDDEDEGDDVDDDDEDDAPPPLKKGKAKPAPVEEDDDEDGDDDDGDDDDDDEDEAPPPKKRAPVKKKGK